MKGTSFTFGRHFSPQSREILRRFVLEGSDQQATALKSAMNAADTCIGEAQRLRALLCVMADLLAHGWAFSIVADEICARAPQNGEASPKRDVVRRVQLKQRERQLIKAPVREFIRSMERRRLGPIGWCSIDSLVRDGPHLAQQLAAALASTVPLVPNVISPYIQVVESPNQRCQFTGLRLMDVWRYFRYTWTMPYHSVPGRSMLVLIRDSAAPNHPIVGIAALASAVPQVAVRDKWIGWTAEASISCLQTRPTSRASEWLMGQQRKLLQAIYKADLLFEGILTKSQLQRPDDEVIKRLRKEAKRAWREHHAGNSSTKYKQRAYSAVHWKRQAQLPLFRAKRCATLAKLLQVQAAFNAAKFRGRTAEELAELLRTPSGRRACSTVVRAVKAQHVGIGMLDITICGAVPPYNPLLGGKLVAMLLCSPEIRRVYEKRYANVASVIASSMAGRPIRRKPTLVLLGTTSLYGERLNQYHRIRIPGPAVGRQQGAVEYKYLGESKGFGSSHISDDTVAEIERLLAQKRNGRKVNSIFGEGVSPRLRKIRDGLDALGLASDAILNHGNRRLVYGIALAHNFGKVLMGMDFHPRFILPQRSPARITGLIAKYWGDRWLKKRLISRPDVLTTIAQCDTETPYSHPARVQLPDLITESAPLFA